METSELLATVNNARALSEEVKETAAKQAAIRLAKNKAAAAKKVDDFFTLRFAKKLILAAKRGENTILFDVCLPCRGSAEHFMVLFKTRLQEAGISKVELRTYYYDHGKWSVAVNFAF
jgi:hypothetical protein